MTTETGEHAMAPQLYETAVANTRRLLAAVSADQWDAPTPCTEWDVRHLVTHLVTTSMNAKSIMDGNGPQRFEGDVLGDDPLAAFDAAVAATAAAFSVPGAMERIVATRRGDQVAGEYALGQVQEVLVHGWDLAKATGQDAELPADVVDVAYARALRNHDRIRATGAYGEAEAPVPADASAQAKYLSILGRAP